MRSVRAIGWAGFGGVSVAAVVLFAWVFWSAGPESPDGDGTKTAEANGVTVTATLTQTNETRFHLLLDTHTVDLSAYDLNASVYLETDDGIRVPLSSDPSINERTSHHVDANLIFPKTAGAFTLVLKDLGGVPERRLGFE